ncbi:hypothetical protein COLO4_01732 [Corchorus olitorius]|uniref:Uncharacterized protein n=1 Tax=Corchorus olitorius TaxID=93759 RepID=A0A1R3L251_9ROSI|nr:hypothetical protein COLO4_01732 [Corchorus olitorius]
MYPPRVEAPKQSRQKEESQAIPERTEPLLTKRKMRALMTTCSRQSYFIRLTDEDRRGGFNSKRINCVECYLAAH